MTEEPTGARLCPSCANTIEEDATKCRFCKAELSPESSVPHWLNRTQSTSEPRIGVKTTGKSRIPAKFIWAATTLLLLLIAFSAGGYIQRSQLALTFQAYSKQLQTKDQMIQHQGEQLNQLREALNDKSTQLDQTKAKLEASQKSGSAMQKELELANREVKRLNASRSVEAARAAPHASGRIQSAPAPTVTAHRTEAGVYQTIRETSVYENPSPQARVVSQIRSGTRINVVSASGNWLEVRSKHGNPPGYVRSDNARLIARN